MSVRFYDDAIVEKIKRWVTDENLRILKPNETTRLFQTIIDDNNDQPIKLPVIAISREPQINVDITTKRPLSFNGVRVSKFEGEVIPEDQKSMHLDAIPIGINYQIDIYTRHYEEADEYIRNFVFNIINHPKMKVTIPYNGADLEHICYLRLASQISDNSDIPERLFSDEFVRWTLNVRVDDAYMFSVPVKDDAKIIDIGLYVVSKENKKESEEIVYSEID